MVVISSVLSQNGWHFFLEIGITFIIGTIIGIATGIRAGKKIEIKHIFFSNGENLITSYFSAS